MIITLPCGCQITEDYVAALCIGHATELRVKRVQIELHKAELDRQLIEAVGALVKAQQPDTSSKS